MAVFKRGEVWWYKFYFAGGLIRETSKSTSKTVAKAAEQQRKRELEAGFHNKSGSNVAALNAINAGRRKRIVVRQIKYLNNIVEQDHRAIQRRTRPMLGFKDFSCARILLSGIELMHMISKGQMKNGGRGQPPAQLFYSLGA